MNRPNFALAGIFSFLFCYPLVHEAGHLLPAVWTGAEVNRFVWTPLLGRPHVSLNRVSPEAMPWVAAGGLLLPSVVGTLMVAVWLRLPSSKPNPWWRIWLLIPGITLLLGNLGLFIEVFQQPNNLMHMAGVAGRLEDPSDGSMIVELLPALWTVLVVVVVALRWRQLMYERNRPMASQIG